MILMAGGLALLAGNPAAADQPRWTPVPQVPQVEYAPNIPQDLFRYQGGFYNFQGGTWFRGTTPAGPWAPIEGPPQVFYDIQAPYFKTPPGWAKGRKTGWEGGPLPPGQMKKFEGGVPPGKAKKWDK
uniref:Uncharacterized protein n=1 Tax=Desulfobacca acetoxidans TaxID=60893 RepID=A0A7C3UXZ8_9BACT